MNRREFVVASLAAFVPAMAQANPDADKGSGSEDATPKLKSHYTLGQVRRASDAERKLLLNAANRGTYAFEGFDDKSLSYMAVRAYLGDPNGVHRILKGMSKRAKKTDRLAYLEAWSEQLNSQFKDTADKMQRLSKERPAGWRLSLEILRTKFLGILSTRSFINDWKAKPMQNLPKN